MCLFNAVVKGMILQIALTLCSAGSKIRTHCCKVEHIYASFKSKAAERLQIQPTQMMRIACKWRNKSSTHEQRKQYEIFGKWVRMSMHASVCVPCVRTYARAWAHACACALACVRACVSVHTCVRAVRCVGVRASLRASMVMKTSK